MKNILFCSVGRRCEFIKIFKREFKGNVVVTDNSNIAPALYMAEKKYLVPLVTDPNYIDHIIDICKRENISGITTFIDPEISILAEHSELLTQNGIMFLGPSYDMAEICFDKYKTYRFLDERGYKSVKTYDSWDSFLKAYESGEVGFPVYVKPTKGSGSVGNRKIESIEALKLALESQEDLVIQELMTGKEYNTDIYIDMLSGELVSVFTKEKLSSRIGGADKTVSYKDEKLFKLIENLVKDLGIRGPVDMDFFKKDGEYHVLEINPRFGGGYIHADACGVNFANLISKNLDGIANQIESNDFEEGVAMLMYDSVVIVRKTDFI